MSNTCTRSRRRRQASPGGPEKKVQTGLTWDTWWHATWVLAYLINYVLVIVRTIIIDGWEWQSIRVHQLDRFIYPKVAWGPPTEFTGVT